MAEGLGLYTMVDASIRITPRLDAVSHNIANIQTPGFKSERVFHSLLKTLERPGKFEYSTKNHINHAQGPVENTGNALDLSIEGEGFFAVQGAAGEVYTRKGSFTLNAKNQIVTRAGELLLSQSGAPIAVNGRDVEVSNNGEIRVDGAIAGKVKIVGFDSPQNLVRNGTCIYSDTGTAGQRQIKNAEIRSGHLELSNVQALREMIDMVDLQRSIETYQKVILTIGDQDRMAASRVGKLS
ncbi:MAG: flagellar hook basal-body protein [Syntrophaceae bacterium]